MGDGIWVEVGCERETVVEPTERVCRLATMFGLGVDASRTVSVVPAGRVRLGGGEIVFVTGASGSGKSTLLRQLADGVRSAGGDVLDFGELGDFADEPLVDVVGDDLAGACRLLSLAGLGDAFVMLRKPSALSDGQRYRLRLAVVMAMVEGARVRWGEAAEALPSRGFRDGGCVVVADEFGAVLDRLTAKVVSRAVRKWVRRTGVCFVAATTHDDLLESLEPDVLVEQRVGGGMTIWGQDDG